MISKHDVVMSILACLTLLLFWLLGYIFSRFISLPASVMGLLSLFLFFVCLGRVPTFLLVPCQFLLRHLSLFFIAPLAGAWLYVSHMGERLWLFLGIIIVTTWVSLWLTSWISVFIFKLSDTDKAANKDV